MPIDYPTLWAYITLVCRYCRKPRMEFIEALAFARHFHEYLKEKRSLKAAIELELKGRAERRVARRGPRRIG